MSEPALRLPEPEPAAPPVGSRAQDTGTLDTAVAEHNLDLASSLRVITAKYGKTYQQLLLEIAKTSFGPGRLSFEEYIALRLFDDKALAGADKSQFLGLDASRRIWVAANHNAEWWGLMRNKLAVTTLLGGYGFPAIPTVALYSDKLCMRGAPVLREPGELAKFLRGSADYPLFGKPMDSLRSLGSASFEGYDSASDSLILPDGRKLPLLWFVADVAEHYPAGYIFQRRVAPHPAVRAIAGDRLATVRVMTILKEDGPQVFKALWKIPAGSNIADNFWRSGNLLATLDLATGRVVRVVRGSGLSQEELTHHPQTGAALAGIEVPNWDEITKLACEAAATLGEVPLIGWDMAAVEAGALIVEPNFTPDFFIPQLADRRGMLDERFKTFLAGCKAASKDVKKKLRHGHIAETRERVRRLGQTLSGG